MEWLLYIAKILYQPAMTGFMYLVVNQYRQSSEKRKRSNVAIGNSMRPHTRGSSSNRVNLSIWLAVLLSLLGGVYSVICGPENTFLADREYYADKYATGTFLPVNSLGIYHIQNILRPFSQNPYVFFFATGTLFLFFTLLAFRNSEDADSQFFLLLCVSQYLMYGCYQVKQSLACALSGLAVVLLLRYKRPLLPGLLIALAICFHEAAWAMVPVFLAVVFSDNTLIKSTTYICLALLIVFFPTISRTIVLFVGKYMPGLSLQMTNYVDDSGSLVADGTRVLSVLKGAPFFIVTVYSLVRGKQLKQSIRDYDAYALICVVISATTLLGAWSTWMWRFGELLYVPFFAYVCKLFSTIDRRDERILLKAAIILSFALITYRKLVVCYFSFGGII